MGYKVKEGAGEVQVPRAASELFDVNGNHLGFRHENRVYFEGEVIPDEDVSPVVQKQVENGGLHVSSLLEYVNEDGQLRDAQRAGVPFEGYDDLSVEDVVNAMRVLPGEAAGAVKRYEANKQNRPEIVLFDLGRFEGVSDRVEGNVGSPVQDATPGVTANTVTREVGENNVTVGTDVIGGGGVNLSSEGVTPVAESTQPQEDREVKKPRERAGSKASSGSSVNKDQNKE
jgi:hypothetical protein